MMLLSTSKELQNMEDMTLISEFLLDILKVEDTIHTFQ